MYVLWFIRCRRTDLVEVVSLKTAYRTKKKECMELENENGVLKLRSEPSNGFKVPKLTKNQSLQSRCCLTRPTIL